MFGPSREQKRETNMSNTFVKRSRPIFQNILLVDLVMNGGYTFWEER
jgi:hypothetical protein